MKWLLESERWRDDTLVLLLAEDTSTQICLFMIHEIEIATFVP